jgi:hypothetical protein
MAGTLERQKVSDMHASREEYQVFPLTVFRDHFYKELICRNESSYWIVWKQECKQAKQNKKDAKQSKKKSGR